LEEEFTDKNFIRGKKNKLPFSWQTYIFIV
jgi:hypothetical protein